MKDARPLIEDMEIEKRLDMAAVTRDAIKAVEETGIVFIDEIDKVLPVGRKFRRPRVLSRRPPRAFLLLLLRWHRCPAYAIARCGRPHQQRYIVVSLGLL